MKNFRCHCGQQIFFENTFCNNCKHILGYDPNLQQLFSLDQIGDNLWQTAGTLMSNQQYRLCQNHLQHHVCNWLVDNTSEDYCLSCSLTQIIPNLSIPQNIGRWATLENAKRRLIHTLLSLHLPVVSKQQDIVNGLSFVFLEDQSFNPNVSEEHIMTGHVNGTITINIAETDTVNLEATRQAMNESYRTLLGHFRHESGHHYWNILIKNNRYLLDEFRTYFGDENLDYSIALQNYYNQGIQLDWQEHYISAYAQSHPLEDWAESWAHYLHMVDTLDTAHTFNLTSNKLISNDFASWLQEWIHLTIVMNSLNRSMGLPDAYPFVLSKKAIEKLRFIHRVISCQRNPIVNLVTY